MSYQLQEINRRIDQDVKGFLEECDAQYAQKVSQADTPAEKHISLAPRRAIRYNRARNGQEAET